MTDQRQTPSVAPPIYEWELRNGRTRQVRTFEQTELTIDGEARLVGLGGKIASALAETGYSFEQLGDVLTNEQETNWRLVLDVLTKLAQYAPDLVADLATILLGIYPAEEDGSPNPAFEADRAFLRSAMNVRRVIELLEVFVAQNDYRRLMAPFGLTLTGAMAALRGQPASVADSGSDEPSSDGRIVGIDGSPIELEPEVTPSVATQRTGGRRASASATPTEPSAP